MKQAVLQATQRRYWTLYLASLVVNDLVMLFAAYSLAYWLRYTIDLPFFYAGDQPLPSSSSIWMVMFVPLWLLICGLSGLYNRQYLLGGTDEYARVFRATSTGLLVVIFAGFLAPELIIARGWLLLYWWFSFFLIAAGRFCLRRVIYALRRKGYFLAPALIIGANLEGFSLAQQLLTWRTSGLLLKGFVDKKYPAGTLLPSGLKVLGDLDHLDELIREHGIEELILASSSYSSRDAHMAVFQHYGVSDKINVRMSSGLYEIITTGLTVKEFAYVPLVGVNKVRLTGLDRTMKFILDYTLGSLALALALPVMLVIAVAVRRDSPGPVFHRRRVMGVNGRTFDALKFRTMYTDGDEILARYPELKAELERTHKLKDDPRVTKVGQFLRKYSLDELPQIFNVLKRDMSLVGPRMISPAEMQNYDRWSMNLLTVHPGITGLWQVSGRSDIAYEERVRLDMHYIRNWSIWFDLQIILRTIPAILHGHGAY